MAEETVDSLELVISAKATEAAKTVEALATSVESFGEQLSKYLGGMTGFADVLERISKAAQNLVGIKNLKSVLGKVSDVAAGAKQKTMGDVTREAVRTAQREKAWLINPSARTVTGRTRYARTSSGKEVKFGQSANEIASSFNKTYNGSSMTNKELSAQIQAIRQQIIEGELKGAVSSARALSEELAKSVGSKNVSPMMAKLNEEFGKQFLGVTEKDLAGAGMSLAEMNALVRSHGGRFGFRMREQTDHGFLGTDKRAQARNSMLRGLDEISEESLRAIGLPDANIETLIHALDHSKWTAHGSELDRQQAMSDAELAPRIMEELFGKISSATLIDNERVKSTVTDKASSAVSEVIEEAKVAAKSAIESMGGRQFFDMFNQRLGIGQKQMSAQEAAAVFEAKAYTSDAEAVVRDHSVAPGQDMKSFIEDMTGVSRVAKDASESASVFGDAVGDRVRNSVVSASAGLQEMIDRMQGIGRAAKSAEESAKVFDSLMYSAPNRPGIRSFEEYTGADLGAENKRVTESFNEQMDAILAREDAMKNLRKNVHEIGEAGIENTAPIFARLQATNEAAKIQEANNATKDLNNSARMTAETFSDVVTPVDVLQMKLDGVGKKLEEALNAKEEDPGKIARLTEQYQKLSNQIREASNAGKEAKGGIGGFHGVMSALGQTIQKGHVGKLATQFWRIAKMRAIRAIIKGVSSALKEGIGNMYQWSKAMNGAFAGALDTIASKSMFAKNSIATAFAPAIQALVPLISTVVGWIHTASNAIAQFFAILNGQTTWTKAIETVEEWGAATKKATGGAAKDVKDLLADWDELNIIQSETGNGGGSGSGKKTPDYGAMFEETSVFDEWTSKFKTIKGIVDAIGLGIGAWFVMSGIEHFLERLGVAGDKVSSVFSRIRKGIVGVVLLKVGFELAEDVGETIAENGFTWQNVLEGIGSIAAAGLGGKFVANAVGLSGFAGSILGISIAVGIGLNAYINKQRQLTYEKMAKDSFASAGKKGFNVEEYKTAIEKELNERIGKLSVTVEAFNTYGPAAEQLNTATKALSNLSEYVFGGKKLTAEQANEFRNNWSIVFESINTMHNATWSTLNLGIADAMKGESEEARKYLAELQKDMIEVQRLTGGAQAAWRTEMTQISGRIASNTASKEDLQRYEVLLELISGSDSEISSSLSSMKEWNETVGGFDFGDGAEAVENALGFISDMDSTYSSATEEVEAWGDAQKKAISAAKRELEAYHNVGLISDEDYDESLKSLDKWDEKYKEKVAKDLAEVERVKSETYGKIFEQVLRGFYINDANGGSVDEYLKSVQPVIEELEKVWTLPQEWYEDDTVTYQLGDFNFTDFWTHLFGQETNSSFGAKIANPILSRMMGEEDFNKFIRSLYGGNEPFGEIRYEVTPTALPEDAFETKGKEPETVYFDSDKWEFVDGGYVPKMGTPEPVVVTVETELPDGLNYGEDGSYALAVKDASLTVHIGTETDGNIQYNDDGSWEWTPEKQETVTLDAKGWEQVDGKWVRTDTEATQKPIDESPVEVLGIPTEGGWLKNFWDRLTYVEEMEVPGTSGSSSSGRTGWFTGVPNEQITVDATASGMATDDNINNLTASTEQGMNSIEGVLTMMRTVMNNIENYARQTAAKDLTVVISPTSALGRTTGRANEQYEKVSGDFVS